MLRTTLCYIEKNGEYLMLHRIKKKNDRNEGKWIGVGGTIEPGETPEECVKREVLEETGLIIKKPLYRGVVRFIQKSDPEDFTEDMYLYTAAEFTGELHECNEGVLEWVKISEVGNLPLWEGDKIFLELLKTETKPFYLRLYYVGDELRRSEISDKPFDN